MSLVNFKPQNHPQQTGKRGPRPEVDDRATAPEVFGPLHERFRFTLDVAALPHNTKLERHFTPDEDGLVQSWAGERVWCNPPYSSIEPWVAKAWTSGAELVVMLLPANRTEQGWWQRLIEPYRDRAGGIKVEFLAGRMRFVAHDANGIRPNERPPFGVCLAIWDRTPPSFERVAKLVDAGCDLSRKPPVLGSAGSTPAPLPTEQSEINSALEKP